MIVKRYLFPLFSALFLALLLAGCPAQEADESSPDGGDTSANAVSESASSSSTQGLTAEQKEQLEGMIASAEARYGRVPRGLKEAYRFAADHRSELEKIPCWCGCARSGHEHNRDCFFKDDGSLDGHSVSCGVCVQTALMVKQGLAEGDSLQQIRRRVDERFSRVGPEPTPTPEIQS